MGYLAVLLRLRFSFFFCNSRPILFRVFRRVLNHIPCDPSWYKMGRDWLHRRRLTSSITEPLREKVDDCRRAVDSFTATRNDDDTFNDPVPSLDAANTRKNEPKKATVITKKNIDSTLNHLTLKNIFESAGIIDSQKTRLQTPRGLEVQNTSTYITVESIKARKRRAKTWMRGNKKRLETSKIRYQSPSKSLPNVQQPQLDSTLKICQFAAGGWSDARNLDVSSCSVTIRRLLTADLVTAPLSAANIITVFTNSPIFIFKFKWIKK